MADATSNRWKERHPCITAKAGGQWGNVTTAQLFACGVTGPVISRLVAEGRLDRVLRGVYSVGHRSPAPEAMAKRLTSVAKLRAYVARRAGARGAASLRRCIEGRQTRSRTEEEFARWLSARGIEEPELNAEYGPYTIDAIWPTAGLVIEIDTFETHGTACSFEDDRRRDAYTAARGLRTIRVTPWRWRHDAETLERDIRSALAHGLRRQLAADLGQ